MFENGKSFSESADLVLDDLIYILRLALTNYQASHDQFSTNDVKVMGILGE